MYSLVSNDCWGYSELDEGDCSTLDAPDSTEFQVFRVCVSTLQLGALDEFATSKSSLALVSHRHGVREM